MVEIELEFVLECGDIFLEFLLEVIDFALDGVASGFEHDAVVAGLDLHLGAQLAERGVVQIGLAFGVRLGHNPARRPRQQPSLLRRSQTALHKP